VEYADGASIDNNKQNNTASIILTGASSSVGVCVDSDGDGYGWNGRASCRPISNASEISPQYTDPRTGQTIYLSRAAWTAVDLANRTIECRPYAYDNATNQYLVNPSTYTRYRHFALNQSTNTGTTEIARFVRGSNQVFQATAIRYHDWTIDDGLYSGPAPFARSPYLQVDDISTGRGSDWRRLTVQGYCTAQRWLGVGWSKVLSRTDFQFHKYNGTTDHTHCRH
jgi:hypothetical protein